MSQALGVLDLTFTSAADLTAKQYFLVKLSDDKTVNLASAATDNIIGVLQNKPDEGEAALVRVLGTSKVSAGTPVGVAYGNFVTTDSNGQAIATTTTGNHVIGIALESASTAVGDVVEVLISRFHHE
jgi:hypothetical protein